MDYYKYNFVLGYRKSYFLSPDLNNSTISLEIEQVRFISGDGTSSFHLED